MVVLPEAGTETTIPSDCIFDKSSTMHTVDWCDLSFHFVQVSQLETKKHFASESPRIFVVSSTQLNVSGRG